MYLQRPANIVQAVKKTKEDEKVGKKDEIYIIEK